MKKKPDYLGRAKALRSLGVEFGFALNKKMTPAAKASITKKYRQYSGYLKDKNHFRLVPINEAQRRELSKTLPKSQLTSKGAIIQVPEGGRARVTKAGRIIVSKGRIREETYTLSRKRLAIDPRKEIERLYYATKGTNKKLFITFKGYQGSHRYTLFSFLYYLENELLPDLDENEYSDNYIGSHFGIKVVTVLPKNKRHETPLRKLQSNRRLRTSHKATQKTKKNSARKRKNRGNK